MKKAFLFLCTVLMSVFMLTLSVFALECEEFTGNNSSSQNYYTWASPVKSYLSLLDGGRLMRVQYLPSDGRVLVECRDSTYNLVSRRYIPQELPLFGGFFDGKDAYYILTGKNNPAESDSAEVFRITKYDKEWNRLSSASLYGVNTTVPFDAGSARFAESGDYLIIRTCHEMYKSSDGLNHQANVTIQLDSKRMVITDYFTGVSNTSYGYVSHSFNQFAVVDNDKIVALDHGDAYPRSIVLTKYKTKVSSGKFTPVAYYNYCQAVDMLPVAGEIGDNDTNCSVGGFEMSSSSYIAAICSVKQGSSSQVRNIYVSVLDKSSTTPELKKLTDYTDTNSAASTPHLVKTGSDSFIIMWEKASLVYYCELDGKGNIKGGIHSFEAKLSDCKPIISAGKAVWYVWKNNEITFYNISLANISETGKTVINTYHSFYVKSASGNTVSLLCDKCNKISTGSLPTDFSLWWASSEYDGYYVSAPESPYHPCEEVGLWARYTSADYNEYEITSSDTDVIKIIYDVYGEPVAQMCGEGTAKITISSKYNEDIKKQYTVKVAHSWQENKTDATCTQSGKVEKKCSYCGENKTETIPALGHNMGDYVVTKQPTCTAQGKKVAACSRCDEEVSEAIEKLPHDEKTSIKATSATCTKSGKTEGKKCSMCGKITVEQETIPALGHNMGEYVVTKQPTCTAQGKKVATCSRCDEEVSEAIEKLPHDEKTSIKATSATCTKSGKTEGKKCSMCGKITVEQETIPALGHNMGEYKVTKEPTCTAQGKKIATCSRCDEEVSEAIEKLPHDEKTNIKATSATCTKSGKTEGKKCSMCGKVTVEQETISALGHNMGEYKVTEEPTCTAQGEKTAYCNRCNKTVSESIPRNEHKEEIIPSVEPSCTKSGKTQGKKCSVCGRVLEEQKTVEKLGHSYKTSVLTKASRENHGEIRNKCSRCGNSENSRIYMIKTVKTAKSRYAYNGKTPKVSVKIIDSQKNVLKEGEDYTVSVGSAKKVGTHTATVKFKGKYEGSEKLSFDIVPGRTAKITASESTSYIKLTWSKVSGATGYRVYQYDSKAKSYKLLTSIKGKNSYTVKNLKSGTAYKFAVKAYTKLSDGTVYWGTSVKAEFGTKPLKVALTAKAGTKSATLSWQKISGASGYQIYYSTSKNGEYKKLKSLTALTYKKTGLTKGKTYYFKVRAYKKVDGKTLFGAFSDIKSVKVK